MAKTAPLFEKIDAMVDGLITSADDASVLSSTIPARKMLSLFMSLKKPFEKRILATFCTGHEDAITNLLQELFASRQSLPYFQSMISLSYFYWNWLRQYPLKLTGKQIDELTLSLIYGAIGYKLLDTFCDEATGLTAPQADVRASPRGNLIKNAQTLYLSKYLIACQESTLARHFDNPVFFGSLQEKYGRLFCNFGVMELACKYTSSPIKLTDSIQLGYKSAPLMLYFSLALEACGLKKAIPDYERIFFLTTSAIQIHDDICDAVDDLQHGNITLATSEFVKTIDLPKLKGKPSDLKKAYTAYIETTVYDRTLFRAAEANLEEALAICRKYKDNMFELFIESKLLGVLEKINRREARHEKGQREQGKKNHRGTHR